MDALVVHGFHEKERDFGEVVEQEYYRRYPRSDKVLITQIKKPAFWGDEVMEVDAYDEIISMLRQHKPKVLIDFHHSDPIDYNDNLLCNWGRYAEVFAQVNDFNHRMYFKSIPLVILYTYFKPDRNIQKHLLKNKELGGFFIDLNTKPPLVSQRSEINKVTHQLGISYLLVEALLRGKDDEILKDAHYHEVVDRSVNMIHDVSEAAAKKPLLERIGLK
jgi:hypothetical protein